MPSLSRRSLIVLGTTGLLGACSATMPLLPMAEGQPEALTPAQIAAAINATRKANGQPAWNWNASLAAAAKSQADLMARRGQMSHNLGVTLRERVTAAGYYGAVGENLAAGQKSLEGAIQGWLNSPGHRSTLLSDKFVEFGLAVARPASASDKYGIYWAMIAGGSFDAWRTYL